MDSTFTAIATQIARTTFLMAAFLAPALILAFLLQRAKRRYQASAEEPFTSYLSRAPGESLRVQIEKLSEHWDTETTSLLLVPTVAAAVVSGNPALWKPLWLLVAFVAVSAFSALWFRRVWRAGTLLWRLRLAFKGEQIVGELLNKLMLHGYHVFHDIPFDKFNIDHVVVGPPGVFAVETKTRRKPRDKDGKKKWQVVFDGTHLTWPRGFRDNDSVRQAADGARDLATWLSSATGESVTVSAILTIPGWEVVRKARGRVNVLNPKEIVKSFPDRPENPLPPAQLQRIVHQLTERCRVANDSPSRSLEAASFQPR